MNNLIDESKLKNIMNRIQSRRLELKLSYQDLANKTNMSKSTLQRYETGSIKNMPIDKLDIIAKALDVSPLWILGFEENIKIELSTKEKQHIEELRKLNIEGTKKVFTYTKDLSANPKYQKESNVTPLPKKEKQIWEEEGKEYLMPKASHDKEGDFTEEDYKHDDDLMNDEDIWK
ncbi:TPA: helix-turn-helix domain-containing protein [Clostridium perfringens]